MGDSFLQSIHFNPSDPGREWFKEPGVAIEAESPSEGPHIVTPNVIRTSDGRYRMYFTSLRYGSRAFEDSTSSILSAISQDGLSWQREAGPRLEPFEPHASLRVLCPDVVPLRAGGYRMYFEASSSADGPSRILSSVSADGLSFDPEAGIRFGDTACAYGSPRCIYIEGDGSTGDRVRCRLYFHCHPLPVEPGSEKSIISAVSKAGLHFTREHGTRISQDREEESLSVYAPEVIRLGDGSFRMYYAGWTRDPIHGRVFSAHSADGLAWTKDKGPCIDIGGEFDKIKASEPCVVGLPDGRCRLYYEASDTTGQWRILSAVTPRSR